MIKLIERRFDDSYRADKYAAFMAAGFVNALRLLRLWRWQETGDVAPWLGPDRITRDAYCVAVAIDGSEVLARYLDGRDAAPDVASPDWQAFSEMYDAWGERGVEAFRHANALASAIENQTGMARESLESYRKEAKKGEK
jgi:hypothetical protein